MITEKKIMEIIKEYAKSPQGKAQIKQKYGVEYAEKVDKDELKQYGEKMKAILFKHITPLIDSISMNDIIVGDVKETKEGYQLQISFRENSLRRESLYLDGYYGDEELQNIVLLFARGYHARDYVYGYWSKLGQSLSWTQDRIRSKKDREPNPFLKEAVAEFNSSAKGLAIAKLEEKYNDENTEAL